MKYFNVYKHPQGEMEAVVVAFSATAFFFGIFWMLSKGLFKWAGIWFLALMALGLLESASGGYRSGEQVLLGGLIWLGYLVLWVVPGYKAHEWLGEHLLAQGYEKAGYVAAATAEEAISISRATSGNMALAAPTERE